MAREEVIEARQMGNGQVKLYFTGEKTQQEMIMEREWAQKFSSTAHVAMPSYQVLVHDIPFSFDPENLEHLKELMQTNREY